MSRKPSPYCFVSPDGVVHRGEGITRFALDQGLQPPLMQQVHSGDRNHHFGWTVEPEFAEQLDGETDQ